jgi:ribosomal protein L11 methyltransferase
MSWLELKIETTANHAEEVSTLLDERGALAITTQDAKDQPLYESLPGTNLIWDHVIITGLFEEQVDLLRALSAINTYLPNMPTTILKLEDQNWERAWEEDFNPMQFGERLWIVQSSQAKKADSCCVILDPGLAFGTGKHPTTALCLHWLAKNINAPETLIDYGCGSGILAIAALKLGAAKVYAIDHDPQAIWATKENGEKNQLDASRLIPLYPDESKLIQADILVANILANPLIELAPQFSTCLPPGGKLVLSGILQEQANALILTYQTDFEITCIDQLDEWVRIDAVKK